MQQTGNESTALDLEIKHDPVSEPWSFFCKAMCQTQNIISKENKVQFNDQYHKVKLIKVSSYWPYYSTKTCFDQNLINEDNVE